MRAEGYDDADFVKDPAGFAHHVLYLALQQFNEREAAVFNRGRRGESKTTKVAETAKVAENDDTDRGESPHLGANETFEEGDVSIYVELGKFDDKTVKILLKHPDKVNEFPLYRHDDLLCCSKDATCMTDVGELSSWANVCAYFDGLEYWESIIPQSLWQRAHDWIMAQ